MIDIRGIDKAELLAGLFNASRPLGLGFFNPNHNKEMTLEESKTIIEKQGLDFDYLNGRVMKVDLSGNTLDTALYNRDNGDNAAEKVVEKLRVSAPVDFNKASPTNLTEMILEEASIDLPYFN